jgi:hypothetical protein
MNADTKDYLEKTRARRGIVNKNTLSEPRKLGYNAKNSQPLAHQ